MELTEYINKFNSGHGGKASFARSIGMSSQNFNCFLNTTYKKEVVAIDGGLHVMKLMREIDGAKVGDFVRLNLEDNLQFLNKKQLRDLITSIKCEITGRN